MRMHENISFNIYEESKVIRSIQFPGYEFVADSIVPDKIK